MTLTGKNFTFHLDLPNTTVKQLKAQIHIADGIPCNQQRFIFGGNELLEGDRTLSSYNIQDEDTVHLVLRLCGC